MPALRFDKPECIFIRIPKTASTSVITGILKDSTQVSKVTSFEAFPHNWEETFSFAFVRNPYERIISALRMFKNYPTATAEEASIKGKLNLGIVLDIVEDDSLPIDRESYVSKLRLHHLPMTHPRLMLDRAKYIARFENFHDEIMKLASMLGIENPAVPWTRQSGNHEYRQFFSKAEKRRFENIFKADIENFYRLEQF